MKLWRRLYNSVWLAFFCCLLVPRWMGVHVGTGVHALLGVGLLALVLANARTLATMPVPARLQRISKVTVKIALFQLLCGVGLGLTNRFAPSLPVAGTALHVIHVVCALAMLAQASSVATAYDMWEEKEFDTAVSPAGSRG
jgi:hypothetical protein